MITSDYTPTTTELLEHSFYLRTGIHLEPGQLKLNETFAQAKQAAAMAQDIRELQGAAVETLADVAVMELNKDRIRSETRVEIPEEISEAYDEVRQSYDELRQLAKDSMEISNSAGEEFIQGELARLGYSDEQIQRQDFASLLEQVQQKSKVCSQVIENAQALHDAYKPYLNASNPQIETAIPRLRA